MPHLANLKNLLDGFFLTFKHVRMVLLVIVVLSVLPGAALFFLPSNARLAYAYSYTLLSAILLAWFAKFISDSLINAISIGIYNRKHHPREWFVPEIQHIASKLGISYNKPIYITDNPSVRSPYTNAATGKITLPESWLQRFPHSEVVGTLGHEVAHVKRRRRFNCEVLGALLSTGAFTITLDMFSVPVIVEIAEIALSLLMLSAVLWRNEYRADMDGALATSPEALIAVFQQLADKKKSGEGSFTHPPLARRIEKLMKLLQTG